MRSIRVQPTMIKPCFPALLLGATLCFSTASHAAPEPAASADDFVNRIGFATHWGYTDTPYGYEYEKVSKLLADLRVRHVRDGFHPRERELWEKYGIQTTMIVGPQELLEKTLQTLRDNRDLISMVEGPNEVDIFATSANYQGQGFPGGPKAFQNDLQNALKADPLLKDLEIIAPSTARSDSNLKLAPMTGFDYLVMHSYAGGEMPSSSLTGNVINNMLNATRLLGGGQIMKPIVVTESGYHTALGANQVIAGVQPGISEGTQAKYLPRHFAEYFNVGIKRTISYEFVNEFKDEDSNAEASFGIVRRDLTPKPAYFALKNLLSMLGEAKWNAEKKIWDKPPVKLRALDFDLNAPPSVHHTLLQKSDGDFYLLLWNEVSSFDTKAKKKINSPLLNANLKFKTPFEGAELWTLEDNVVKQHWQPTQSLTVPVPDEIIVLHIKPTISRSGKSFLLPAPQKLQSATGGNEATLNWQPVRGAQGYFVWRVGRYLGFTAKPQFEDKNLQPNTGYPYEVRAFDAQGFLGEAAQIIATTKNEFPDLVVTEISWTTPKIGDEITLSATLKNQGLAASPMGSTHGVAFFVDDQFVSWSDTFNKSLAPGETITVICNNGPKGKKTFTAVAGTHKIRAVVDDVNRINESDETNNQLEKTLTVAP